MVPNVAEPTIIGHVLESRDVVQAAFDDSSCVTNSRTIAGLLVDGLGDGAKVLIAGHGDSAGDAQHIAGEFLCRPRYGRAPSGAIAGPIDSPALTTIGYGRRSGAMATASAHGRHTLSEPGPVFGQIHVAPTPLVWGPVKARRHCARAIPTSRWGAAR